MMKQSAFAMLAACCVALPGLRVSAASESDCLRQWKAADRERRRRALEEREAARYVASYQVHGLAPPDGGRIKQPDFMSACKTDVFVADAPKQGDPLKGTSNLTEAEAKEHAVAAGFTAISSLVKDGEGNWRGSAMKNGYSTQIAVDQTGNVYARNE